MAAPPATPATAQPTSAHPSSPAPLPLPATYPTCSSQASADPAVPPSPARSGSPLSPVARPFFPRSPLVLHDEEDDALD
jgi:hypothetical protein